VLSFATQAFWVGTLFSVALGCSVPHADYSTSALCVIAPTAVPEPIRLLMQQKSFEDITPFQMLDYTELEPALVTLGPESNIQMTSDGAQLYVDRAQYQGRDVHMLFAARGQIYRRLAWSSIEGVDFEVEGLITDPIALNPLVQHLFELNLELDDVAGYVTTTHSGGSNVEDYHLFTHRSSDLYRSAADIPTPENFLQRAKNWLHSRFSFPTEGQGAEDDLIRIMQSIIAVRDSLPDYEFVMTGAELRVADDGSWSVVHDSELWEIVPRKELTQKIKVAN